MRRQLQELLIRLFVFLLVVLIAPFIFLAHYFFGDHGGKDGFGDWVSLGPQIFWQIMRMGSAAYIVPVAVILMLMVAAKKYFLEMRLDNATEEGKRRNVVLTLFAWAVILIAYLGSGALSRAKAKEQHNREEDIVEVLPRVDGALFREATDIEFDYDARQWKLKAREAEGVPWARNSTATCLSRDGSLRTMAPRYKAPTVLDLCATDDSGDNVLLALPDGSRAKFLLASKHAVEATVHDLWR